MDSDRKDVGDGARLIVHTTLFFGTLSARRCYRRHVLLITLSPRRLSSARLLGPVTLRRQLEFAPRIHRGHHSYQKEKRSSDDMASVRDVVRLSDMYVFR